MTNILSILIISSLCLHVQVQAQTFMCDKANNTLGTCECDMQLFIAENCTKGFFCYDGPADPEVGPYEGCEITCTDGYQLLVDPRNGGGWKCIDASETVICPGKFNTECECKGDAEACPIGECDCDGQLRVSHDCKTAKFCETVDSPQEISCNKTNEIVYVNLHDHSWSCGENDNRCPGAFHVGCQPDPTSPSTTTTTTTITTTTTNPITTTTADPSITTTTEQNGSIAAMMNSSTVFVV